MSQRTTSSRLEQFRKLSALHITYLKYIGLWALDSDSSALSKCLYFAYNKFILIIMLVFMVTLLADICSSFDDLSIVTDDGCIFAGIVVVFFKVMIFQTRREQIVRLLCETIDGCDQLCKFSVGGEDKILGKYLLLCRVTFYGFSTLGFFLVIALLFLVPVEDGGLPVRALYPFDTTKYPWHMIGFFVEACTVSVGMTAIIGMDSLHTNLCNLFLVQLGILSEHFESCGSNGIDKRDDLDARYEISSSTVGKRNNRERDNYDPDGIRHGGDGFVKRFRRSIRNHQRLLAIMDDFNEVFSAGMFVQMLSSTLMICLTGFQAALVSRDKSKCCHGRIVIRASLCFDQIVGQSSDTCKFAIYLAAAVSQLFYICWVGNEVMYQSASLTQSQWLSGWSDELSVKTGRLINLSMIFSKRTLNLKAGVFYVLSMETFIAILRGSYSFFALLSTMQSEGDQ
ncbi:odorant receptor 83a-like [Formica exsecta]|uniref:odorant receptor 83a-like n=1 Tax=Formica exsecta TaxID=72781 RepID=UPI001141D5BD|nr:odorant receptor 83a-like [Formica exsecta]